MKSHEDSIPFRPKSRNMKCLFFRGLGLGCIVASMWSVVRFQHSGICLYATQSSWSSSSSSSSSTQSVLFGRNSCPFVYKNYSDNEQDFIDEGDVDSLELRNDNPVNVSRIVTNKDALPLSKKRQDGQVDDHTTSSYENQSVDRRPKRLFLGIFSALEKKPERQLCHLIRNTYLQFYDNLLPHITTMPDSFPSTTRESMFNTERQTIPRICTWQEFLKGLKNSSTTKPWNYDDCHIVYTFVANAPDARISPPYEDPYYVPNKYTVDPATIDFENLRYVRDMIFLDKEYQMKTYPNSVYDKVKRLNGRTEKTLPCLSKVLALYDYLWNALTEGPSSIDELFGYVAFSDVRVMLYPTHVWPMTDPSDDFWYKDNSAERNTTATATHETSHFFYGGMGERVHSKTFSPVQFQFGIDKPYERYVMLSANLFTFLMEKIMRHPKTVFDNSTPGSWIVKQLQRALLRRVGPDYVALENSTAHVLYRNQEGAIIQTRNIMTTNFAGGVVGLVPKDDEKYAWEFLKKWETYKDSMLTYGQVELDKYSPFQNYTSTSDMPKTTPLTGHDIPNSTFVGPRILMGIFTMDASLEAQRRTMIRNTYLNYYQSTDHETQNQHRICSLQSFVANSTVRRECQLVYTFVVGGLGLPPHDKQDDELKKDMTIENNITASEGIVTDMLDVYHHLTNDGDTVEGASSDETSPLPMTVDSYPLVQTTMTEDGIADQELEPNDIVFLNIHENMNEGKTQTWFLYASTINVHDDVEGPSPFVFDYVAKIDSDTVLYPDIFLDKHINVLPRFPNNSRYYGGNSPIVRTRSDLLFLGPYFFQGSLYVLSWDLAYYVTNHLSTTIRKQYDANVEDRSMSNWIRTNPLPIRTFLCIDAAVHPVKNITEFQYIWESKMKKRVNG